MLIYLFHKVILVQFLNENSDGIGLPKEEAHGGSGAWFEDLLKRTQEGEGGSGWKQRPSVSRG